MSRHQRAPQRAKRFFRGLGTALTHLLLFVAACVVFWGFAYTLMKGYWWVVPSLTIVLVPPTLWMLSALHKRRRYLQGSKVIVRRYSGR